MTKVPSRGVIDHIWDLQEEGTRCIVFLGNHEQMLFVDINFSVAVVPSLKEYFFEKIYFKLAT